MSLITYADLEISIRERWIVIYCTLQTLAGLSVDVPNLSFKGDVAYFLNTRLQGLPPWSPSSKIYTDASREQSHCWTSPMTWADDQFDRLSPKISHSYSKSDDSYGSRPLSPESQTAYAQSDDPYDRHPLSPESSSFTFFNSSHHTPIGELEARESFPTDYGPPTAEKLARLDQGMPPEYRVLPSKFAATAGVPQYLTKPLPLRPGQGTIQRPHR